ncbi:MAG: YraN family protein [Lachnospiraceae bacterium]|nr:YraN family protein [Lachnospiraceae bacterium]
MNNRAIGTVYEIKAAEELIKLGYTIIEKNFYCKGGEIDIIAKDGEYLCFIEVKYRTDNSDGDPLEAVDTRKIKRICKSAVFYMTRYGYPDDTPVRFDVVSILGEEIMVIKNAFDYI